MSFAAREFAEDPCSSLKRGNMVRAARNLLSAVTRLLILADMVDVHLLLKSLRVVSCFNTKVLGQRVRNQNFTDKLVGSYRMCDKLKKVFVYDLLPPDDSSVNRVPRKFILHVHVLKSFCVAVSCRTSYKVILFSFFQLEDDLEKVKNASNQRDLMENIDLFGRSASDLMTQAAKRQQELKDPQLRDDLAAARAILKKHSTMLLTASKVCT